MKLITFQNVVPFACACIPVKLKFAKIHTAETPPSVPAGLEVVISVELAMEVKVTNGTARADSRRAHCIRKLHRLRTSRMDIFVFPIVYAPKRDHAIRRQAYGDRLRLRDLSKNAVVNPPCRSRIYWLLFENSPCIQLLDRSRETPFHKHGRSGPVLEAAVM
jgi:hypothetical protein